MCPVFHLYVMKILQEFNPTHALFDKNEAPNISFKLFFSNPNEADTYVAHLYVHTIRIFAATEGFNLCFYSVSNSGQLLVFTKK